MFSASVSANVYNYVSRITFTTFSSLKRGSYSMYVIEIYPTQWKIIEWNYWGSIIIFQQKNIREFFCSLAIILLHRHPKNGLVSIINSAVWPVESTSYDHFRRQSPETPFN